LRTAPDVNRIAENVTVHLPRCAVYLTAVSGVRYKSSFPNRPSHDGHGRLSCPAYSTFVLETL
jgi:hypothetical protein